jgi:uncharacterized protein involved in copper resistance
MIVGFIAAGGSISAGILAAAALAVTAGATHPRQKAQPDSMERRPMRSSAPVVARVRTSAGSRERREVAAADAQVFVDNRLPGAVPAVTE